LARHTPVRIVTMPDQHSRAASTSATSSARPEGESGSSAMVATSAITATCNALMKGTSRRPAPHELQMKLRMLASSLIEPRSATAKLSRPSGTSPSND
jgi:hypothetical protein